jgi:hypothetical protein
MGDIPMLLSPQITQNLCTIFELLSSAIVLWNLRLAHLLWNVGIGQVLRRRWVEDGEEGPQRFSWQVLGEREEEALQLS